MTGDEEVPKATRLLAEFAVNQRYDDLPPALLDRLRTDVLDSIAVGIFGSTLPWITLAAEYWEELGGKPEATVWGRRAKLPVIMATLANSHAQNAFELDMTYLDTGTHSSNNVVPAAMGISELLGAVSGRDFITAVAIGQEVGIRVRRGIKRQRAGFNHTAITSTFGAAASAGRLLRLDSDQMTWALGSAGSYVGGILTIPSSSMVKRMVNGRAAQGGVMGALLARRNFTGIENVLEATQGGFYSTFAQEPDWASFRADLGKIWYTQEMHTKRYPFVTNVQAPIEATLQLVRNEPFSVDEVEKIIVRTTTAAQYSRVGWAEPETISAAQFSLPFAVASAVLNRRLLPRDVTMENVRSEPIAKLMKRIEPVMDPEFDRIWGTRGGGPASVEITLTGGRRLRSEVVPQASRMTNPEIEAKAMDAMTDVIGRDRADAIVEFLRRVDQQPAMDPLFALLGST